MSKSEVAIRELMTGTAVKRRHSEIAEQAAAIKGEAEWQSHLAELCRSQAEEIDRLNLALADHAAVPPRRPVLATGGIATLPNGSTASLTTVIDDHGTVWQIRDGGAGYNTWQRLPDLPTPADIAKTLETENERAEREARDAEAAEMMAERAERNRAFGR